MSPFDITVAITAHAETFVAGPTIRSCDAAISAAERSGYLVERLIGLDNATSEATEYFHQPDLEHWRKVPLDVGDLGLARNGLAQSAQGAFLAFMDADDLFSENWLVEGAKALKAAAEQGQRAILHPELNWFFDAANAVLVNPDPTSVFYTPYYWRVGNHFDSLAMADTETFLEIPYRGRDRNNGFGYEDWCWNIETLQAGFIHHVVPDTIIFKRRRDNSLVTELNTNKNVLWELDMLAIDNLHSHAQQNRVRHKK